MANIFSGISGRFRGGGKSNGTKSPGPNGGGSPISPTGAVSNSSSTNLAPRVPQIPNSPSLSQSLSLGDSAGGITGSPVVDDILAHYNLPQPKPLWLNEDFAQHIVRGNFMTLSARPKTVEKGEWIAHQVVEHYRNLWNFVKVIHDPDQNGVSICNPKTCPKMSASVHHSFTWLNKQKQPVEVAAHEYIALMQRWISGKIDDPAIFPTDPQGVSFANSTTVPAPSSANYPSGGLNTPGSETPILAGPTKLNASLAQLAGPGDWIGKSSGFPPEFFDVCQTIFRQMFRVYAHLYWNHFVEPFYHLNLERSLNSCFSHFALSAVELDMLKPGELEPMQPLIDLWAANDILPRMSKIYAHANLKAGERLKKLAEEHNAFLKSQAEQQQYQ